MNNPLELIKMIKNPKEYVMNYAKNNSNPIINNLINEAQKGNNVEVEKIANNILKERGINLNDIIKSIPK